MTQAANAILVVDDDEDIRETTRALLELEGYAVRTACNGAEALEHMRSRRPLAVVLDLMMPAMCGRELRSHMLVDPVLADIPVIIMTAFEGSLGEAQSLKAAGFFQKPLSFEEFFTALRLIVGPPPG
ncbi:MAG TPA: response regulator [Polyangiaceae bacterium]|nr:response regulator [Polyangiaceae bacterium]